MPGIKVFGGTVLQGSVRVSGAKNAATKLLVASLLSDKRTILKNVPNIEDVRQTVELCRALGAVIDWDQQSQVIDIITPRILLSKVPPQFSCVNRIPILLLGALLRRCPYGIFVPILGGDAIGPRSLHFHLEGLEKLGAELVVSKEGYWAAAPDGLVGAHITLPYPSVGATENLILASVGAQGRTLIKNASLEVEIIELIAFLQKAGVEITTDNDKTIEIFGCRDFSPVEHTVIPDKIEAASFGMAAVVSQGRVFVEQARHEHMIPFLKVLRSIGGGFSVQETGIEFFYDKPLKGGVLLETDVHPGFITDWQQPFAVLLSQAEGCSVIHETVHENRLGYLRGLAKMGAHCDLFYECLSAKSCRYSTGNHPHSAVIHGPTPLKATDLVIPDLRAGFAYVMAALIAEGGASKIENTKMLDRGYTDWLGKLESLGARILTEKTRSV
ncbi:UDP-N-acetylglucosamine 1-carboxyvinyltransferase,UDP-N-acetylglucosamine 1-carboxyvinyltransferase 1,UDP-N-acetylglucosamine 1-carboxyvinyltransferase,5-enolpyruvylshikimate-3-phosphate synthase,UDP-N-acetylglucosamine 1-carboxyvinyltransferase,EPSP synthase (3-phosphoshikimate 1-carboxyvinyltransferase) [Chlamydia suis]|uniref:UDP-N-acetylglucosamine 1-carboxyvinyltransferase n=1 Tax=Chlamydia suis TaxID=83559 RepID=UPI0009AFC184|nr:UDP-N-acetylglucosamine 1-carboxyvinyltransferase [Chlamydia suis]SIU03488.1 UDP-N-acetylglucosamine 1-carboxyvinyltransferase,UDP-N-acetylglucosamine 1-carboxyvinyltransferase 1,UDP-N-acetylglucosamine 1-carboxyvinyltransferase,5-enolpyruvylshikimate-3-phosphate synthase,UDP-N-acetylglucosamine 1-carboxyvinyltransferase,EPSP synthase (3-phosphoshikimate 1-carboxyvinyltransferase) [Chlamydia suis]